MYYRDKLLNFIILLSLTINGFIIDLNVLAIDLKLTGSVLSNLARESGCQVVKDGTMLKAELRAPLVFPALRVGAGKKK